MTDTEKKAAKRGRRQGGDMSRGDLTAHYSASQLRNDSWNKLKNAATRLMAADVGVSFPIKLLSLGRT